MQVRLSPDEYIALWSRSILSCLVSSATPKPERKEEEKGYLLQVRLFLMSIYIALWSRSILSHLVSSATPKPERKGEEKGYLLQVKLWPDENIAFPLRLILYGLVCHPET